MKIYTKTGDAGNTSLYDGSRAPKFSVVFQVLGEIDELNSRIGLLCTHMPDTDMLRKIQRTLQDFNSHIATIDKTNKKLPDLPESLVLELENMIDEMEKVCPKLTKFLLNCSFSKLKSQMQVGLIRKQNQSVTKFLDTYS